MKIEIIKGTDNNPVAEFFSSSSTPETDAAWACFKGYMEPLQDVKDLSRKLERERNEALEKIKQQKLEIVRLNGATNHAGGTPLKIALRERDEAREELIHLRSCVYDVIHSLKSGAFDELEKAWKEGLK